MNLTHELGINQMEIEYTEYIELSPEEYWIKEPKRVTAWFRYAEYLAKEGNLNKAISIYEEAMDSPVLTLKVRLSESYARFAVKYLEYDVGMRVFKHAFKVKNSTKLKAIYIDFLIKFEKHEEAEELLLEQIELTTANRPWFKLAKLYETQEYFVKAIPIYEQLIEKNPSNGEAWKRLRDAEKSSQSNTNDNTITKSISFEPQYHTAGLTILQNFGSLLNKEYPNGDVAFTIEQQGMKITMVIEHPLGHKEIVEDYLNRYGLVVSGEISPEQFIADPVAVMDLKRQIIHLEADMKWADEKQRMLEGTISNQDSKIIYFQEQLKNVLSNNHNLLASPNNLIDKLIELTNSKDNKINLLVEKLIDSAKSKDIQSLESISTELNHKSPNVSEKIKEFVTTTVASASGNAPAWIDFLSRVLP
jgi:tetratricopeptide (TPR) repeat protein